MVLFLFNFIFSAVITLSNTLSWLIFTTTAHLLVLLIQGLKVTGEALKGGLEQAADFIKACVEYLLELALEAAGSVVAALFDVVKEGVTGLAAAAGAAIGGLIELTRNSIDGLLEGISGVLESLWEIIWTMITDLWNNCMEAIGYVGENA